MHKRLIHGTVVMAILLTLLLTQALAQNENPEATSAPACQNYRLTVDEGRIRACPSTGCSIIGGVTAEDTICVLGPADEAGWLSVDIDPSSSSDATGYISDSIVEVGVPGGSTSAFNFCDAYEVIPPELIVRSCGDLSCSIVDTLVSGDRVCAEEYDGEFNFWLEVYNPVDGLTGFVEASNMEYQFEPALGCANDNSWVTTASANVRSCGQITCDSVGTIPAGTSVCVTSETDSDASWISVTYGEDETGWVSGLLLRDVEDDGFESTPIPSSFVPSPTAENDTVTVAQASTPTQDPLADDAEDATEEPNATSAPTGDTAQVCPAGSVPGDGECIVATPFLLSSLEQQAAAQPRVASGSTLSESVPLTNIGAAESIQLQSPLDSARFNFSLPENWAVEGDNTLFLDLAYFETYTSEPTGDTGDLSTTLDVLLDNTLVASLSLRASNIGNQTLQVPLPADLLNDLENRNHTITVTLEASDLCNVGAETRVVLSGSKSNLDFQHRLYEPILDINRYPRPIYHVPIDNQPQPVYIIMPDAPTNADIQALANISAGLGQLTFNQADIRALPVSALTDDVRNNRSMITIGTPDNNALIGELYESGALPTSLNSDGTISYEGAAVDETDGVLQVVANPANDTRAILVVTGATDESVSKASSAIAGQPTIYGISNPVLIIDEINQDVVRSEGIFRENINLFDLGFTQDIVITGSGIQTFTLDFNLPRNAYLTADAYFDMIYNYSMSLSSPRATITLYMNNVPIASTYLAQREEVTANEEVINQFDFRRLRAFIPPSTVFPGESNRLDIVIDMRGDESCDVPAEDAIWFSIANTSEFFLPRSTDAAAQARRDTIVGVFPQPFNETSDLSNLYVSLPQSPSFTELNQMTALLARIGAGTSGLARVTPNVVLGDFAESTDLSDAQIIAIGRHTTNPFIAELNDVLPQPFVEGTDNLQQVLENVTYRLSSDFTLGVLQTLPSPYNANRSVLVVTGTNELGQTYAANALINRDGNFNLAGNLVFVNENRSNSVDTRLIWDNSEIIDALPDVMPSVTPQEASPTPQPSPTPNVVVSVTAEPIPTLVLTPTPETVAVQGGFVTVSAPTFTPSPVPTIAPLEAAAVAPGAVERPEWVDTLIIATVIAVNLAVFYGLFLFIRSRRRRDS